MTSVPLLHRLGLLAVLCLASLAAPAAVDESELLPVDTAFAIQATAPTRDRIEVRWTIVEGYYLYRHRMGAQVQGGGFTAKAFQLPDGKKHVDEFFGPVETYRTSVTGILPGTAADGVDRVQLQLKFQGCADLGICYPPQVRTVTVALPPADGAKPALGATPTGAAAPSAGFADLGRSLGSPGASPSLLPGAGAGAKVDRVPLPPEQAFRFEAIAADGDTLLLRWTPAPGYYLYRDRSTLRVEGDGVRAGKPRWPKGTDHRDEHFGNVVVYFDRIDVPLPVVRTRRDATGATVTATFQGCQTDGICYPPMTRKVTVALPASTSATPAGSTPAAASPVATTESVAAAAAKLDAATPPATDGAGLDGAATTGVDGANGATTTTSPDAADTVPDASGDNALRTTPPAATPGIGLLEAWLLGLLGGLLLNLMPCVLPILSLKVVGLVQSGDRARSHALWYTAGVLVAFAAVGGLVLGLRAAGQAMGWGFQLQQPWFVAALVYVMCAVGLGLSGVVTLGGGLGNLGQSLASRGGRAGDFFTGVLACVVASPCIAPFMGGALAFAFAAPAPAAISVFLALGLGLALPFLLIGYIPALARLLPAPGAWMETLKQVMAFPMYLAAVWLAWVLGKQRGVDAMALVAVGIGVFTLSLWIHERSRWRGSTAGRALAAVLLVASLVPVWGVTRLAPPAVTGTHADGTVPYSAERLAALRAEGRPVFVNMTADWCVTCKANERRVFKGDAFRTAMTDANAVYMVGDWTNPDPAIEAFLDAHNAVGVPLYVVYPGGDGDGAVLPAVLTDTIVRDALAQASR